MKSIKDVAAKAGVSAGTVSKVLKGYGSISETTRNKVLDAVKELRYIPNSAASTLSSKGARKIAIYLYINDKFQQIDEINMLYVLGALDRARELGIGAVTVYNETLDALKGQDCRAFFRSLSVDSIAVFGLNKDDSRMLDMMEDDEFRFAVIDAPIVRDNISCISVDHRKAQHDVADQIIMDHDHVIYLSGKDNGYVTDLRLQGIMDLKKERDFGLQIIQCDFSESKAFEEAMKFIPDCDTVVCASDLMAIGVRKACQKLGVTRRISGFDGIRLLGYVSSSILTVRQDFYQLGARAIDEIVRLRMKEKGREVVLPYEIGHIHYHSVIK